jgi:choline kinase
MKGIILAAGRGSRLHQMTAQNPKCLVNFIGKPLLEWQMRSLNKPGVSPVAIVAGYRSEMLAPYSSHIFLNERWEQTNMVASLACAKDWLRNETCIISYSDIVYHPSIVEQLVSHPGNIVIAYDQLWLNLWEKRFADPLSDAETFVMNANRELIEIGQKTTDRARIQGQYMGLLKITPSGWQQIETFLGTLDPQMRDKLDMTSLLNHLLHREIPIQTTGISGKWCEIDNQTDLEVCERMLKDNQTWSHDFRF